MSGPRHGPLQRGEGADLFFFSFFPRPPSPQSASASFLLLFLIRCPPLTSLLPSAARRSRSRRRRARPEWPETGWGRTKSRGRAGRSGPEGRRGRRGGRTTADSPDSLALICRPGRSKNRWEVNGDSHRIR